MIELAPNNPYGLSVTSPVLTAAGCFGYGVEYARMLDIERIGAIVTRSTTAQRWQSHHAPRLIETPAGVLVVGTWPNPGLGRVLERFAPIWAGWRTPVLLSILGSAPADYAAMASALEGVEGIAGLELNLAAQASRAAAAVAAVRAATLLPIIAKLPADDVSLPDLARAVAAAGADAITACAGPPALAFDPQSNERVEGMLCGPALYPLALRRVAVVAAAVDVPVIGCGGIATAAQAQQMLNAGATAVQVGSALLVDPGLAAQIADTLRS